MRFCYLFIKSATKVRFFFVLSKLLPNFVFKCQSQQSLADDKQGSEFKERSANTRLYSF